MTAPGFAERSRQRRAWGPERLARRGLAASWSWLRARPRRLVAAAVVLASPLALAWIVPVPERLASPPSTVLTWRDGSAAHVLLAPDDRWRMAISPDEVDPAYLASLLAFEDRRFALHPGVDPLAVLRAAWLNVRSGRVVSGGSTLTMQLVRLLEPRPRTLASKAVEALRAVQLELRMSKGEILAAYLAFLPYGGNVEGVEAASWSYFGHSARELSADEIAVLLAVPQSPLRRAPAPANRSRLLAARDHVAHVLAGHGVAPFTDPDLDGMLAASRVPDEARPMPRAAPHAAFWLASRRPGATRLVSTLDRGLEEITERRLAEALAGARLLGVHNAAAVVVDHRSGEVRALVGNPDFFDDEHGGQIVGFDVPRSPGSALKPFLYALALDRGLALPDTMVPDLPAHFAGWSPRNYDDRYQGLIRLDVALSWSLNLPFVNLLREVGVEPFLGTLRAAGVRSLVDDPGHYGLSAAIGGVELTPLEVATLYAALAEGGRARPLAMLADDPREQPLEVLSGAACWLTRRALARRDRPDFPERRRWRRIPTGIHWKTGTSVGHRDAWAAGSDDHHTAVVWLGNFDRRPAVDLVGAELAGPVLFDLLEAAGAGTVHGGDPRPPELVRVDVCAFSGRPPGPACPERRTTWAIADRVPTSRCRLHVAVDVDLDTGLALTPACRAGRRWETRTVLSLPADVRRLLGHRAGPSPPTPDPACTEAAPGRPPAITSPSGDETMVLVAGLAPDRQEVPFLARADGPSLDWFVDGRWIGRSDDGQPLWWTPSEGRHEVVAVDAAGRSARRRLEVVSSGT